MVIAVPKSLFNKPINTGMILTSTQLAQLASKWAALSSNQANLSTEDFLTVTNLIVSTLTAECLTAREEFLLYEEKTAVTPGTNQYRIPYRAVNGEIRHIWFEDATGNRTRLYGYEVEDIENFAVNTQGAPGGFFVMGNTVNLLPIPNVQGNLVFVYPFRPNMLTDQVNTQAVLTTATSSVTVANMPTTFTNGALYDIIDHLSGNGIVYYDLVGSVSGTTVSFAIPIPLVAVGNWIALAGTSPVPMLPEEGHPLLLETTIMRLEMIRGNTARVKNSSAMVQDARKQWDALLNNRVVSKAHTAGGGGPQRPLRPW